MHEAYKAIVSNMQVPIESITGYDNNIIIGSRQGYLVMYSVDPVDTKMGLQLICFDKNFSKKTIVQIEVVPEYQLLFSLTDGLIMVHSISTHNFLHLHTALETKGATVFCVNVEKSESLTGETVYIVRLCVSVKRKLQFWYFKQTTLLKSPDEIELNDIPKSLAWLQNSILVGFKTEYVLYELSGKKRELFPTSSSRTIDPCMTKIGNDLFAVAKDDTLIPVSLTQTEEFDKKSDNQKNTKQLKPVFKSFTWSQSLQMLVWDEPYAIALVSDALEIRILDEHGPAMETLIQTIPDLQKARLLVQTKKGLLFAASVTHLWCIQAVNIPEQRKNVLKQKKFQLALQLTKMSDESPEDKTDKVNIIQSLYANDLFEKKHFKESMDVFAKLNTDVCDIIRLFPGLLPQDLNNKSNPVNEKNTEKLEGKDLEYGLLALIDFLIEARKKGNLVESKSFGKSSTPLLSIIDTTLLKCYLQTNDSLIAPLIRLKNCHLDESERTLKQYQKFGELIILYQTKGHHAKALELLKSQAQIAGSSLFGHDRTIKYLQNLGSEHKHIIFDFAGWVLKEHPDDGLKIFIEDIHSVENLPRAEVLDFLLKNHKSLVISYLEHVIHVWNEIKPIFHNILIQQYQEKIKELKSESNSVSEEQKEILLENIKSKLIDFLQTSNIYTLEQVLADFPQLNLERATILGKLNRHEKVIAIFIQNLGDISKAMEYCENVYENKVDSKSNEVYMVLIRILLTPPTSTVDVHPSCLEPDISTVLEILEKHSTKINPYSVLQILPSTIPLWRLKTFLEMSLHHQLEQKRKTQVLKGLLYAENLQIQEQRMYHESKSVLVTDFSVCPVCKKKFSNQSAFVRRPDGNIVHFSCQDKN